MYELIIPLFLAVIIVARGFKVVGENEKGVVFRLGKVHAVRDKGITWIIPFFEIMFKVKAGLNELDLSPRLLDTGGNGDSGLGVKIGYEITDIRKAVENVAEIEFAVSQISRQEIKELIKLKSARAIIEKKVVFGEDLRKRINSKLEKDGIRIESALPYEKREI